MKDVTLLPLDVAVERRRLRTKQTCVSFKLKHLNTDCFTKLSLNYKIWQRCSNVNPDSGATELLSRSQCFQKHISAN